MSASSDRPLNERMVFPADEAVLELQRDFGGTYPVKVRERWAEEVRQEEGGGWIGWALFRGRTDGPAGQRWKERHAIEPVAAVNVHPRIRGVGGVGGFAAGGRGDTRVSIGGLSRPTRRPNLPANPGAMLNLLRGWRT